LSLSSYADRKHITDLAQASLQNNNMKIEDDLLVNDFQILPGSIKRKGEEKGSFIGKTYLDLQNYIYFDDYLMSNL